MNFQTVLITELMEQTVHAHLSNNPPGASRTRINIVDKNNEESVRDAEKKNSNNKNEETNINDFANLVIR